MAEKLLKVKDVAARLGVSMDYVYRRWQQIPGAWKISPKVLRFRESEFDRFIAGQQNESGTLQSVDNEK